MSDEWSFQENMQRGCLPTGEPLEALYGVGYWTDMGEDELDCPPIVQCHICGGNAYDLGDKLDCENCGEIGLRDVKEEQEEEF